LSASAHELWATFVYHQWRRTPDMQSRIMSPSNALAIIETGLKDIEEKNGKPLDREVREKFLDPKYVTRFHQNARESTQTAVSGNLGYAEGERAFLRPLQLQWFHPWELAHH
jgi:hypothetical protein